MRRFLKLSALLFVAFATACRDGRQALGPTDPQSTGASRTLATATCLTYSELQALVNTVYGAGSPNANSALGKLDNINKLMTKGNTADAQANAKSLITFIQQKAVDGGLPGTHIQVQELINGILCFVGLPTNTFLIYPTDAPQVIKHPSGLAGVSLQGNTVNTPSLLTIDLLDPNGPSPLITKLDKYPEFIQLTLSSPLTKPAVVGVCPSANVPNSVEPNLRLGHQGTNGFEILPPVDVSGFLSCQSIAQSTMQSKTPGWIRRLASFVTPKMLYAQDDNLRGGGVGGTSTEFSPFGPVDAELDMKSGGVGGTSTEFMRTPLNPPPVASAKVTAVPSASRSVSATSTTSSSSLAITCASTDAVVGSSLAPECRPRILLTTHNGTIMQNVPVSWSVTAGGGTIAAQNMAAGTCGSYGTNASTATDATGKAGVCWTLGGSTGTNTVVATPSAGGDAPAGVTFDPSTYSFNATAVAYTTTTTLTCPASVQYTGIDQNPCSATVTAPDGLNQSVAVVYSATPHDVGAYTATATFAASGIYLGSSDGPKNFSITKAPATATAGSGSMSYGGSVPALGCVVTGLLGSDAGSVTCTTSVPSTLVIGANTTTPVVSPSSPTNYAVTPVNGTLTVGKASTTTTVTCPSSPVAYTGATQNPCTASVSGNGMTTQSVTVVYNPATVRNAGAYQASATFAETSTHLGSSGSSSFSIAKASATATAGSGTMLLGGTVPTLGCVVTGLVGTSDIGPPAAVTCTTAIPTTLVAGANVTTPVVSPSNPTNYAMTLRNGVLSVLYSQKDCFASPVYNGSMPPTKSAQKLGSNLPVKCTLQTAQGAAVTNATGGLVVYDLGLNGTTSTEGVAIFSKADAFSPSSNGTYSYGLNMSAPAFQTLHYYRIVATWSDGSTTVGYIYVK